VRGLRIDGHSVGRYERGERSPRPYHLRLLCHVYGATPAELGYGADELKRRDFLRAGVGVAGIATGAVDIPGLDRLLFAFDHPSRVDEQTCIGLELTTVELQRLDPQLPPTAPLGSVIGHFNGIARLLREPLQPSTRRQLTSLAGESAALAALLHYDLDNADAADAWCQLGLVMAKESEDAALGAYLLGRIATRPAYREEPEKRLQQLAAGVEPFAVTDGSVHVQAWLATKAAEAHLMLGRAADCERSLEVARNLMAKEPLDEMARRSRTAFVNDAHFHAAVAACAVDIGQPSEARAMLNAALAQLDPR
jgi:hypothetical protein